MPTMVLVMSAVQKNETLKNQPLCQTVNHAVPQGFEIQGSATVHSQIKNTDGRKN